MTDSKLTIPPMPEPSIKDFTQGRIQSWGHDGWQTAQREAALADELAEALEAALKTARFESHPDRPWHFVEGVALAKHKEARNG